MELYNKLRETGSSGVQAYRDFSAKSKEAAREQYRWFRFRLPATFSVPLLVVAFIYFIVAYPWLVYHGVPLMLRLPVTFARWVYPFGAVSQMGMAGWIASTLFNTALHITSALLTLVIALLGVLFSYGTASWFYGRLATPRAPSLESQEPELPQFVPPGEQVGGPLDKFTRIGIILSGGGAKGAYQAGAMKAIYEFLDEHKAHSKVKMIAGTSIGSWNALFWLSDMVKPNNGGHGALEEWWSSVEVKKVIRPVKIVPSRQNFLLSNEPWQFTFDDLYRDTSAGQRLMHHLQHPECTDSINFYFTRSNVGQARLEFTTNKDLKQIEETLWGPRPKSGDVRRNGYADTGFKADVLEDIRQGVFSSMDLPPLFEYSSRNGGDETQFYEDGGVIDNLPIRFGTEVEGCDLLFILPLNASFVQEVDRTSVIRRLARVTNIRQGVLERNAFKMVYLYNELAALRERTVKYEVVLRVIYQRVLTLKKFIAATAPALVASPESPLMQAIEAIKGLVEGALPNEHLSAPDTKSDSKDTATRASARQHKKVRVFSICPEPKLLINTAEFWKTREAHEAFDFMHKVTANELKNFQKVVNDEEVSTILVGLLDSQQERTLTEEAKKTGVRHEQADKWHYRATCFKDF
ncbi:MAG TPA: patatin-like phospholipase family protein [Pyrinomonadaceae bacterium]|nr:patatin-like phospholipase family protein [Pyrinomonadaceae bacterium]